MELWRRLVVSALVLALGIMGAQALERMDQELRIMYTEYTLAATDLVHVLTDVIRYRNTILRAIEMPTQKEYDRVVASLPEQRKRIEQAVARFGVTGTHVSRSGRSEPEDLRVLRGGLADYFEAADQTVTILNQVWNTADTERAVDLRGQAERHAAATAGAKLVQVTFALEHLLETVAEVGKELRRDATTTIRIISMALLLSSIGLALANLLNLRRKDRSLQGTPGHENL